MSASTRSFQKSHTTTLTSRSFHSPGPAYRGAPFWSWNNRLSRPQLRRQIGYFQQMGFGGFQMHARTGLVTPYLGPEFLDLIADCTEDAASRNLLAWLYDEDRWPSGFGGGLVTRDPAHRMKYLLFTQTPYNGTRRPVPNLSNALAGREEHGRLLARYAVRLEAGLLVDYRRLKNNSAAPPGTSEWFAYLETAGGAPWYNHQGYADLLDRRTTRRFIQTTHERFQARVGKHFGGTIPAIFTDEPQHVFKACFDHAAHGIDLTVPATGDFFATYQVRYGEDLLAKLPEVFWELPTGPASSRYRYHDHVTERFSQAFAGTLGKWCARHGLMLTGHMMEEPTLFSQTRAIGEAMRSLAHFHLPGVDMLCDRLELTTAKQAQSVARQYGRPGVMSELYGVTGWDYPFVGHKAQGDWQAALGVTVRVPHLAWVSMAGEAKRDYPASINYQSPWFREYKIIEDHFARLNVVLTRGRPVVRIAVIHPIESYWLFYGPLAQTKLERERQDGRFQELPHWLLGSLLDFDYLCEALLPSQTRATKQKALRIGRMSYDVVVVPSLRTVRSSTLDILERFMKSGGTVIFAGDVPELIDAEPSTRAKKLARRAATCPWDKNSLVALLEAHREVDCRNAAGIRTGELFYQLRADGAERHLFLSHLNRNDPLPDQLIKLPGAWRAHLRETMTGRTDEIYARQDKRHTVIPLDFQAHGHALLTLRPGKTRIRQPAHATSWRDIQEVGDPVSISLSEPNVLLLNQAEWRWNDGAWQPAEEILRLDNRVRQLCGLPPHEGEPAQPWVDNQPAPVLGRVSLRFRIKSDIRLAGSALAVEEPSVWAVQIGSRLVPTKTKGWWVDEAIRKIQLPNLSAGEHVLTLSRDYTRQTHLEWCYLLGDFGVSVAGRHARLHVPVRRLSFGDWTRQGLPFYAGNVTYHCTLKIPEGGVFGLHFPRFSAPLLRVSIKGGRSAPLAFAPFRFELGPQRKRTLPIAVTAYGNRHNGFGPLHNTDPRLTWVGPEAWRSCGPNWAYEYQLKPMGLLVAPRLQINSLEPRDPSKK